MSLPKWIPPKDHAHILDDGQVRNLIEGIAIAVEALEFFEGREVNHCCEDCPCGYWETNAKEALRQIESLGKDPT